MTCVHSIGQMRRAIEMADLPSLLASRMSGSENETPLSCADRSDQLVVIVEIVLEIGILNQDDVAPRDPEASPHRMAFTRGLVL